MVCLGSHHGSTTNKLRQRRRAPRSLFDSKDISGAVSSVDTKFFVDHTETLEALTWVREGQEWPLGELFDGYEFLLIIEVRRRDRWRSRSTSRLLCSS